MSSEFENTDTYLGGAVALSQPPLGLKAGLDSVLLSASLNLKDNQQILDLGSGCFQIGVFLHARNPSIHVTGVEVQQKLLPYGLTNIENAGASGQCRQVQADILDSHIADVPFEYFDHIVTNPPYFTDFNSNSVPVRQLFNEEHQEMQPPPKERTYARQFQEPNSGSKIAEWLKVAKSKLKPKGYLHLSLSDRQIIMAVPTLIGLGFGGIEILPLYPTSNKPASLFLISTRKGSNSLDHTYGGLILRDHKKAITHAVSQIAMNPIGVSWFKL